MNFSVQSKINLKLSHLLKIFSMFLSCMQFAKDAEISSYLLSAVCHDLANSLMILGLNLEKIQSESAHLSGPIKISLQKSLRAHRNANDILFMARQVHGHNTGKLSLETKKISLKKCLQKLLEDVQSAAQKKELTFEFSDWVEGDEVFADETILVHQVLYNLISNSIKFSFRGSCIHLSTQKTNGELKLFISDSGQGMSRLKISKVFQMSEPTSTPGTENEKGYGMGLPIVHFFLKLLGARIQVYSREKSSQNEFSGTCFEIIFPDLTALKL